MNRNHVRVITTVSAVLTAATMACTLAPSASAETWTSMYDVDGNGLDPYAVDTTGDGRVDQNTVTSNGQLVWLYDTNQNWQSESVGTDANHDGIPDLWGDDPDENGTIDSWRYDPAVFVIPPASPSGLTLNISNAPLGTDVDDLIATVNSETGVVTDPCAFYNGPAFLGTDVGCYHSR